MMLLITCWRSPATRIRVGCRQPVGTSTKEASACGGTAATVLGGPKELCRAGTAAVGRGSELPCVAAWCTPKDPQDLALGTVAPTPPRALARSLGDRGLSGVVLPPERPCASGAWGVTGHGFDNRYLDDS